MGDNIKDAPLHGVASPVAKKGWSALSEQAGLIGVLEADYGSTCLRLSGGRLLIDRTSIFSEDEFHRAHREYERYGIKDYWIISASAVVSPGFMERHGDRCIRMVHANRSSSCFIVDGKRYSLSSGLDFIMTGKLDTDTALKAPARNTLGSLAVKHRGGHPKVTLRPKNLGGLDRFLLGDADPHDSGVAAPLHKSRTGRRLNDHSLGRSQSVAGDHEINVVRCLLHRQFFRGMTMSNVLQHRTGVTN